MSREPASTNAFACVSVVESSPTSSGSTIRWAEKYGAMKQPSTKTSTSRSGNESMPASCSRGMDSISGTRTKSQTSIVFTAPRRETTAPLGMPSSAIGSSSAASTIPMRVVEPVVVRTNHGSARNVICAPSDEITSALSNAKIDRWSSGERCFTRRPRRPASVRASPYLRRPPPRPEDPPLAPASRGACAPATAARAGTRARCRSPPPRSPP